MCWSKALDMTCCGADDMMSLSGALRSWSSVAFHDLARSFAIVWPAQRVRSSFEILDQGRRLHDTRVNHDNRRSEIWMMRCQLEGNIASHAVADHDRFLDRKLAAEPDEIVGESGQCVRLLGLVALAVATEIDSDHSLRASEVIELRSEAGMVAGPAVDEHH
jgi:hypothetical protein